MSKRNWEIGANDVIAQPTDATTAAEYDEETSTGYAVGDLCTYKGYVYVCKTKIDPVSGEKHVWNKDEWTEKTLASFLNDKAPENPTFTEAAVRENISSGDPTETLWGKVKKVISDFVSHLTDGEAHQSLFSAKLDQSSVGSLWSENTTYSKGSNCVYNGEFYVSKVGDNTGHKPTETDYWDVVSLFSTGNTTLTGTIEETVPATALKETDDDGEYELDPGAANPWDEKASTISCGSGDEKQVVDVVDGDANITELFSREDTSEVAVDGLLNNAELEKSVKVCAQKYGGTQIKKDDEGNYYYEVETED